MKRAILFWCYKNLPICIDRLRHLRSFNPDTKIFALFGGEPVEAAEWERGLARYIDDFYCFEGTPPPGYENTEGYRGGVFWKYVHGDWMFASWYRDRGIHLDWDTFIVIQWDMLVFGPVDQVFACLEPDQCLFSGLRPVREVEQKWAWVAPSATNARATYLDFLDHVKQRYGFDGDPLCCLAIVVCLSRAYMEEFARIERPELGGLEYRLPIYAQAFGIPLCQDHPFKPWWAAVEPNHPGITLRARPVEIWIPTILANLRRRDGARVFHPYWRPVPRSWLAWTWAAIDSVPRVIATTLTRAVVGNRQLQVRVRKA